MVLRILQWTRFLCSNQAYFNRSIHFLCEEVDRKDLDIPFISTMDQVADSMTKGLPTPWFSAMLGAQCGFTKNFACAGELRVIIKNNVSPVITKNLLILRNHRRLSHDNNEMISLALSQIKAYQLTWYQASWFLYISTLYLTYLWDLKTINILVQALLEPFNIYSNYLNFLKLFSCGLSTVVCFSSTV